MGCPAGGGGGLSLQRLEPWRPVQDNVQNNTNQKHPPPSPHTQQSRLLSTSVPRKLTIIAVTCHTLCPWGSFVALMPHWLRGCGFLKVALAFCKIGWRGVCQRLGGLGVWWSQ